MLQGMHRSRVIQALTRGPSASLGASEAFEVITIEHMSLQPLNCEKESVKQSVRLLTPTSEPLLLFECADDTTPSKEECHVYIEAFPSLHDLSVVEDIVCTMAQDKRASDRLIHTLHTLDTLPTRLPFQVGNVYIYIYIFFFFPVTPTPQYFLKILPYKCHFLSAGAGFALLEKRRKIATVRKPGSGTFW